tara:strand:+ start:1356 stop:2150 length:795 start_codon:yes stop_codon:yes gene_type:complete
MQLHLYTTDPSGLDLAAVLGEDDHFTAVIVPKNRENAKKVLAVREQSEWPVTLHTPGSPLPEETPQADAIISWLYSQIISVDLLNSYPRGGINMHGGRIPDYRGANVLNWAIANGETELGVTWHEIVEKVDAGGILVDSSVSIRPNDTAIDIRATMITEGIRTFPEALQRFCDGAPPVRVPELQEGKVWQSRRPEHARIELGWDRTRVWNMIRAQTGPWPDAMIKVEGAWRPVHGIVTSDAPGLIPYKTSDGSVIFLVPSDILL